MVSLDVPKLRKGGSPFISRRFGIGEGGVSFCTQQRRNRKDKKHETSTSSAIKNIEERKPTLMSDIVTLRKNHGMIIILVIFNFIHGGLFRTLRVIFIFNCASLILL